MGTAIEVQHLTKSFGSLKAVDDVSLEVSDNAITILIGPNGSGKTTLINTICGFYKPDGGKVLYRGSEITGLEPHKVYELGLARTFQIPTLFGKMAVLENVMVAARHNAGESFGRSIFKRSWVQSERELAERSFKVLETVGLFRMWDKPANSLSGGQMKLLEIARALISGAKTLLLDEPISGVNPTLAHDIFRRLVEMRNSLGLTFFIIEHRLEIALGYVDNVVAMAYGKEIASGKPHLVMQNAAVIEAYLGG